MAKNIKAVRQEEAEELEKMEAEANANANPESETVEKPSGEKTSESESAPEEEKTPQEEDIETEQETEQEEDLSDEEVSKLSEKAQRRFRKLVKKVKELSSKKREPRTDPYEAFKGIEEEVSLPEIDVELGEEPKLPWETTSQPPEITVEDYKKHVSEAAYKASENVIRRERILSRIASDAKMLEEKYPELNPDSDSYDPNLTSYLYREFRQKFSSDNNLRLSKHVEDFMNFKRSSKEEGRKEVVRNVARQAAEQAMSPTAEPPAKPMTVTQKLKRAKTIKELEELESQL